MDRGFGWNAMTTNRDFYRAVGELTEARGDDERSLEVYLAALLGLAQALRGRPALTLREVFGLLAGAYEAEPVATEPVGVAGTDFALWESLLLQQIRDLREMASAGTLDDPHRYGGIDAPSGHRWYNFDPATYLECATAGALGGWQPGDDGRTLVSGPVAVLGADGAVHSVAPEEIDEPVVEVAALSWRDFIDFLECGQEYE